jgi:putative RNA 2'-phosphotransferase
MAQNKSVVKLGKFLSYILGVRPDEFGLIPDADGYVSIKDLLKVFSEEDGWRHVRQASLNEVMITLPEAPVEIKGDRIRAVERSDIPHPAPAGDLPKLLYTCVRRRAHAFILEKGISPLGGAAFVLLASDQDMAERLGRRIDQHPLLITVQTQVCVDMGTLFLKFGENLYLTRSVPVGGFTAPPLPEEPIETGAKQERIIQKPKTPGSFVLEISDPVDKKRIRLQKKKKDMVRDKERRQQRRRKQDPWSE